MRPSWVAVAASTALLVLVVVPYAVVDATAVGVYYGVGLIGPPVLVAAAGVALVALLSGVTGRSDPAMTAGVSLALAGFVAALSAWWAVAAAEPAGGLTTAHNFDYHRWAFAGAALALFGAAVWNARRALAR